MLPQSKDSEMLEASAGGRRPVVAMLLFDDVEVLDFAGPFEVFAASRNESGETNTTIFTVAGQPEVKCYGGLRVIADARLDSCPPFDVLIVPGGPGARIQSQSQKPLIEFIASYQDKTSVIASVCTGSFLLARTGLLDGRRATTHSAWLSVFAAEFPAVQAEASKIVDEGRILTAGGVTSGIDLGLYLLERWFGTEARKREARRLEGPW
jgi:transcriptional regulator GlxA family with amidase domain